jgi:hypothetical protein
MYGRYGQITVLLSYGMVDNDLVCRELICFHTQSMAILMFLGSLGGIDSYIDSTSQLYCSCMQDTLK